MADSFHWPDNSEVEALDLERGTIARGNAAVPGEPRRNAVAFPTRTAAPIPADAESEEWFVSEDDEGTAPPEQQTGPEDLHPVTSRPSQTASADVARIARRWAIPVLAAVVVLETGWLVADRMRVRSEPAPAARATTPVSPAPTSTSAAVTAPVTPLPAPPQPGNPSSGPPAAKTPAVQPLPAGPEPVPVPPGNVSIPLPFQVQVYEATRFIGINEGTLPLTPGTHQLQLVNDSLGFRTTERVAIVSGRTTRLTAGVPTVRVQLNAVPWAEVTVDGTSVGETPLGNVPMSIGPHTLVFRHPQFGELTRNVVITTQAAARISVDLRK